MDKLVVVRGLVKAVAMAVGFVATTLCLMSLVGLVAESGWIRTPVAVLVAILVPAFLADRLLPEDAEARPPGLVSDVLAVSWMALPLLFAVAMTPFSRPALAAEGDRLRQAEMPRLADVAYRMAAVDPNALTPAPTPSGAPSSSGGTSATPTVTAPAAVPPDPTAAPSTTAAAPSASVTATAPPAETEPPSPKPDDGSMSASEIFSTYAPAVVSIGVKSRAGMAGGGTGFLLDEEGTIATNHHVIAEASEGKIKLKQGAVYTDIVVLAADPNADLALLRIKLDEPDEGDAPDEVTTAVLGDSDAVEVGEPAISIGNPLGLDHTLTTGIVSSRRVWREKQWIQMSTPVSPGNSGGPVFNQRGEVIGVTTAVIGGIMGQNLNLAVPINVLKQRLRGDYPAKRKLGQSGPSATW
ncbi:MAG: trypsin-like peptidase domain-containing protein [Myxococcota bacterium]